MMAVMKKKNRKAPDDRDGLKDKSPSHEPPRTVRKRATILLVDDDSSVRKLLEDTVRHAGHNLTLASDGRQALKIFMRGNVDLVITDIKMPRMDGLELIKQLKREDPKATVIVITGLSSPEIDTIAVKRAGAYEVLSKPFRPDQLREIIDRALSL